MRITGFESNSQLLAEIGTRIKDARISIPLTREELSRKSGVSVRTIANLESGAGATLANVINVLRTLNMLANFDLLIPEQGARPSDLAKLGKKRERASSPKTRSSTPDGLATQSSKGGEWRPAKAYIWKEDE